MKKILSVILFLSIAASAQVKLYTEDAPPLNYVKDGKADGIAVALVQEMQKRLGDKAAIEVVPWARGYDAVLKEENVALFSTTRTEEREKLFKWVGPLGFKKWVFVTKKGSAVKISSLDDAKKLASVGSYKDDAKEQFLISQSFKNLQSVSSDDLNAKKLLAGRIDAWITGDDDLPLYAAKVGAKLEDFEIAYVVQTKELHMAFSMKTSDDIVKKWKDTYESLVKDGTFKNLSEKYAKMK